MPGDVVQLARRHLRQPLHVRANNSDEPDLVPLTVQHVFRAHQMDKIEMLARILQANGRGLSMVFCRTKRSADQVAEALVTRGFAAAAVHGDLGQGQRERAMRAFRNGKIDVLVATDVASRGLDVDDVTHVINYECPEDDKAYLHRTGRTGRAGRDGIAVTFVDWRDMPRWKLINESLGMGIPEPVETYSTSAHLFEELDIPAGVKGSLPRAERGRAGLEAEELEDVGETGKARTPRRPARRSEPSARTDQAPRKARVRKRTRAGVSVHGADATQPRSAQPRQAQSGSAPSGPAQSGSALASQGATAQGEGSAEQAKPRRRRRRSGRGRKDSPAS
jgi:superfamily II DNA/RNA helicase